MKHLERIARHYFPIWTDDGIDDFHADAHEIAAWLKREDLRTDADADLNDLNENEINVIAEMIADMVKNTEER